MQHPITWDAAVSATAAKSAYTASSLDRDDGRGARARFGESFLVRPERPPAELEEPWGAAALTLTVAGQRVTFRGFSTVQADALRRRFEPLLAPRGAGDAVLEVWRAEPDDFRPHQPGRLLETSLDLRYASDDVTLAGLFLTGRLRRADDAGRVTGDLWLPAGEARHLLWAFENVLRVALAYRLAAIGGVLLHGAALCHHAGVDLCYGRSGAGKTTMARRGAALGLDVLSDDLNLVVPAADGFAVHQLPYAGIFGRARLRTDGAPLHGLYRLEQDEGVKVEPLGPARALASLLACAPFVNGDPWQRDRLLRNLLALTEAAWPRRLAVSLDADLRPLPGWSRP